MAECRAAREESSIIVRDSSSSTGEPRRQTPWTALFRIARRRDRPARFRSLLWAVLLLSSAGAAAADLVFAVTEGVTYQATNKEIQARFLPLADAIGKTLHRSVRTVVVESYQALRDGLDRQEYDLAFVHPAHVALREIKAGKYRSVAWTSGFTDYTVSLLVKADQPLSKLDDLRGRTVVSPDPDSITAVMLRAMLRDNKFKAGM